jgi:hypothetical protein
MLTVFTCVTGGFDKLDKVTRAPQAPEANARFVAYTDAVEQRQAQGIWELRPIEWEHPTSPRRTARWHKVNAHLVFPDTEYSMWIDGSQEFKPNVNVWAMLAASIGHPAHEVVQLASFKHPQRTCVFQELEACIKLGKDDPGTMREQIARYKAEGYPPYNGLVETACVIRRHTEQITQFNEAWWREIAWGSLRDQLSFNYVAWKQSVQYGHVPGRRSESPYFAFHPHKRK